METPQKKNLLDKLKDGIDDKDEQMNIIATFVRLGVVFLFDNKFFKFFLFFDLFIYFSFIFFHFYNNLLASGRKICIKATIQALSRLELSTT